MSHTPLIIQPFEYWRLQHQTLTSYKAIAMMAGCVWVFGNIIHMKITGHTVNFFHSGGVFSSLQGMLSVMVGVYFGLAGVFAASPSPWLGETMPNGVLYPGTEASMTRRDFFMRLLVYCAATSTVILFFGSLLPPLVIPIADYLTTLDLPPMYVKAGRIFASLITSAIFVVATTHLLVSSLLGARFLVRSA